MYGAEELCNLTQQVYNILPIAMQTLNRTNQIDELLFLLGIKSSEKSFYDKIKHKKILILGQIDTAVEHLYKIAEKNGISRKRLEIISEYDECAKFDYKTLQYSEKYCMIFFGPQPHKGKNIGNNNSGIAAVEKRDFYPPSIRVSGKDLKITKSSFKACLRLCVKEGYIEKG